MKRALLVTAGTAAGLVSVLSYNPLTAPATALAGGAAAAGLGGPPPATSTDPASAPPGSAAPDGGGAAATTATTPRGALKPASGRPRTTTAAKPSTAPKAARSGHPAPNAAVRTSGTRATVPTPVTVPKAPTHSRVAVPTPVKTHTTSKAPTPTPVPAGPKDFTGSAITYKYGTLQVAIRIQGGKIIDAWAVTFPQGSSLPYSQMAMPILRSQTLSAQSAKISGASGASFTSASWITSLQAALSKAGL